MDEPTPPTRPEICCPECGWKPTAEDRWSCVPSCGTTFNTFWTRGVCPGCAVRWPKTQCFACLKFSDHERWYRSPLGEEERASLEAPVAPRVPVKSGH